MVTAPVTEVIGQSENGINLTVRKFDLGSPTFKIYIQSRLHGDEQESEDATGRFIAEIDADKCLGAIPDVSVHILQVANPDGKILNTRQNFNGLDLNRGYESIESKELRAIHNHIRSFRPHVIIDCHNFPPNQSFLTTNNVAFDHDLLIDMATNPMCRRQLTSTQFNDLLTKIRIENPSYTYDRYLNPDSVGRTRFSTEDIIDTRQGLAWRYDILGFIFEGREPRADETPAVQENSTAAATFGALKSIISWLRSNSTIFLNPLTPPTVGSNYPLRSHYVTNTSRTMDMYYTVTHVVAPFTFTNFDTDNQNYVFTPCPLGYAVEKTIDIDLLNHLTNQLGIPGVDGTGTDKYNIETIHIDTADVWSNAAGVVADQDPPANVTFTYVPSTKTGFSNYKLFFVNNPDGGYQLPFYLEPRAKYGLPRYRDLLDLPVVAGTNYTVLRLITKLA